MSNKNLDIIDFLSVLSFYIGLQNLDENLSQEKAADLLSIAIQDIHDHLSEQDKKIDKILEVM